MEQTCVQQLHHSLRETGALMPPALSCHGGCNVQNEKEVSEDIHAIILTSICQDAYETGLSQQNAVWHTMHEEQLCTIHLQLVQELQPGGSNLYFWFCPWL
jgi:hypothetical protein